MSHAMTMRLGARAILVLVLAALGACVGAGVGFAGGGYDDDYDAGPAFGYDMDFYGPDQFDYGGWGPEYFVGPPRYGYGHPGDFGHRGGFGNPGGYDRPGGHPVYRPAPNSRPMPSIPTGPRGGGMRGAGGGRDRR